MLGHIWMSRGRSAQGLYALLLREDRHLLLHDQLNLMGQKPQCNLQFIHPPTTARPYRDCSRTNRWMGSVPICLFTTFATDNLPSVDLARRYFNLNREYCRRYEISDRRGETSVPLQFRTLVRLPPGYHSRSGSHARTSARKRLNAACTTTISPRP